MKALGDITTITSDSKIVCTRGWVVSKPKNTPIVLWLTLQAINKKKIIENKSTCIASAWINGIRGYTCITKAKNAVRWLRHHCSAGVIIRDGKICAASPSESLLYYYTPTRAPHTPVYGESCGRYRCV